VATVETGRQAVEELGELALVRHRHAALVDLAATS
jgi:hypothetical protein